MGEIGIVIVTHNSAAEIGGCLKAALASGAQVVVVDNASTDGTQVEVDRLGGHLVANPTNRGFAAAVNQGFIVLKTDYVVLLNPDAVLFSDPPPKWLSIEKTVDWTTDGMSGRFYAVSAIDDDAAGSSGHAGINNALDIASSLGIKY